MKKIETAIYEFDELPEKVQETVVNEYELDYEWHKYTIDEWHKKLSLMGYKNPEIQFSGFWSQGDGASFTCLLDSKVFGVEPGVYISRRTRYYHEKSCYVNGYEVFEEKRQEIMKDYEKICKEIYHDLETEYEYLTSKVAVKEHYDAHGCLFYGDGFLFQEMKINDNVWIKGVDK